MRREEDRAAAVAQLPHHALEQMGGLRVQADERLVHHDELRGMEPGRNNGQLLLHAVGVGGDGLGQIVRQLKALRKLADAHLPVRRADTENVRNKVQILDARHIVIEIGIVRDVGKLPLAGQRVRADGGAADADLSGIEAQDPGDGFQRRRLPRAVVADEAVNFAGQDMQAQIVHGLLFAVGLRQMFNLQHGTYLLPFWITGTASLYGLDAFSVNRRFAPRRHFPQKKGIPFSPPQ